MKNQLMGNAKFKYIRIYGCRQTPALLMTVINQGKCFPLAKYYNIDSDKINNTECIYLLKCCIILTDADYL